MEKYNRYYFLLAAILLIIFIYLVCSCHQFILTKQIMSIGLSGLLSVRKRPTGAGSKIGGRKYPKRKEKEKESGWSDPGWTNLNIQPNQVIRDMYKDQYVYDEEGEKIKFTSGVNPREGWYLYKTIIDNPDINNILEVGMANGTSALYICQALLDKKTNRNKKSLISIDPNQSTQWKNVGISQIKRAKLSKLHTLIEEKSEIALPSLLKDMEQNNKVCAFDMIFIDGLHLFDHTLIDIFFSTKLLKIGGVLIIDDIKHASVRNVINYIRSNYTHLEELDQNIQTMATFKKISQDTRKWNFHRHFLGVDK
jgi:predicted O-methyltransferase YrrM